MPDEPRDLSELTLEVAAALYSGTVLHLATTDGPLRDRLFDAYGGVTMEALNIADRLPASFADRIWELHSQLTGDTSRRQDGGRAVLREVLDSMTGAELTEVSRKICFLADDLTFVALRTDEAPAQMD